MNEWIGLESIKKFEIEISSYCNARCPLCVRQIPGTDTERLDFSKGHLTLNQIKKVVRQIPKINEVDFYFAGHGGDPMMNPKIVDIFRYCSYKTRIVIMDTNASLRSINTWKELGKISAKTGSIVIFSIDGLEDTNHIYRIRTNWQKIMENARAFIDAGGNAEWKFIVFQHNQHQIKQAEDLSKAMGFKKFRYENSIRHNIKDFYINPPDNVNVNKLSYNIKKDAKSISCKSLAKKMMYITHDFKLLPCCYFHSWSINDSEDFHNYVTYDSDLNNRSIKDILNDSFLINKIQQDWKSLTPQCCAKNCNQKKYWEKDVWVK